MFYRKLILPIILIILIASTPTFIQVLPSVKAQTTKSVLQDKLAGINTEIENAKKEFNNLESQKKDLTEQVSSTKAEITKIEGLIIDTQNLITELATKIPITQNKIKSLEAQIYKLYKEIQYSSVTSKAEVLLTSKNFGDFMAKLYGLGAIQTEAERISVELKDALAQLEEQKQAQEKLYKQQTQTKYILNSKKSNLDRLIIDTENKQEEYDKKIKAQSDSAAKVRDEISALPSELRNYIYNNGGNTNSRGDDNGPCYFYEPRSLVYPDGYFANPTEGAYTDNFSCYPWSWDWRRNGHDGVDVANGTGTPIVATADGVAVKYYPDFGNSIVLRHELPSGQTVYSLYAHMHRPSPIAIGQEVKQGQVIGEMGSTGFSTGPHLHFMIISDSYEKYGPYCAYGGRQARCYNPAKLLGW
jgi:murein DD-endopeptidase MepM/ murein hydrolase activator NlpD